MAAGGGEHARGLFECGGHGFFDQHGQTAFRAELDDIGMSCGRGKDQNGVGILCVKQGFVVLVDLVAA